MKLLNLSASSFATYGQIIEPAPGNDDDFQIIIREKEAEGWQIALSRKVRGPVTELSRHPNTRETFEPLFGVTVLFVAELANPERTDVFLLDRPVCLFKNIWHATTALTESSLLKITENVSVESHNYRMPFPLDIIICPMKENTCKQIGV